MGDELRVSPDALKDKAKNINNKVHEIEEVLNEVSQTVRRVPDAFQGRAATEFQEKYDSLRKNYEKFSGKMRDYAIFLNETAERYARMDNEIANIGNQGLNG